MNSDDPSIASRPGFLPVHKSLARVLATGRSLPRRAVRRVLRLGGRRVLGTITHVVTDANVVALTFDDGPHPIHTPRLLDLLARHNAKATFFMLGMHARVQPELVRRIANEGHAIANHSFNHPRFPALSSAARRRQLRDCQAAIAPFGTRLFRPPRGLQSVMSRLDALMLGYDVVTWNVIAEDWAVHEPAWIAEQLAARVTPGSIVLLHDMLYEADDPAAADREPVLSGLDHFLAANAGRFSFVTVPVLLTHGRPHRANWFVRSDDDWDRHDPS